MILQSGCRFAVAPHFHLAADWPQRLLVGAGLEEVDDCFFPAHSWRVPTTEELPLLLRVSDGPARSEELEACVSLFQLPGHLRSEWWQLLGHAAAVLGDEPLPGFDAFMDRVGEFLAFKRLPLPADARCKVLVSDPARRSAGAGALLCNVAPWAPWPFAEEDAWPRLWGGINLGDEDTSVVLINLSCQELHAELSRRFPNQSPPSTVGELAGRFLRCCSDHPPVRLILGPGEGYRLPRGGLILAGYPAGKQETDVLLFVSHGGRQPA